MPFFPNEICYDDIRGVRFVRTDTMYMTYNHIYVRDKDGYLRPWQPTSMQEKLMENTIIAGPLALPVEKPKEDNQWTAQPTWKKLWEQWPDTVKADFLEVFYKEQEEHRISTQLPPGIYTIDKSRLVYKRETEDILEIEITEK